MAPTRTPPYRWSLGLLALAFASGCGGASAESDQPSTSDAVTEADFAPLLECDDGAVLEQARKAVEVQSFGASGLVTKKAYALRFVVRNGAIVGRMKAKVAHLGSGGELVLRGSIDEGAPFDFFEDWTMGSPESRLDGNKTRIREQVGAVVHRVQGKDGKVRLVFNRTRFTDTCSTYFNEASCAPNDGKRVDFETTRKDEVIDEAEFQCAPSGARKP